MKRKSRIKQNVGKALEIPEEIANNSVKITLHGRGSLLAENHGGIVSYSEKKIIFNTEEGLINVIGHGLVLVSLAKEELLIEGDICGFVFPDLLNDL